MRVRIAGYQGEGSVHTRAMRILAERLGSSGHPAELTADITRSGRNATDLFAMTEGHELEICYFASSYLADRVPALGLFDLPFAMSHRERLFERLDGELGRALGEEVESRTGFTLLGFWDNGVRHLTNAARPLRRPLDCEGLAIRTMDSALHQSTFAALGFRPVYIDVRDYPAAVRERTVDAQENPLTNIVNFSVEAVHKHLTMSAHFHGVTLVLGNRQRLSACSDALPHAMAQATAAQRGFAREAEAECRRQIEMAGVEILDEGAFDRDAFVEATRAVRRDASAGIDARYLRMIDGA